MPDSPTETLELEPSLRSRIIAAAKAGEMWELIEARFNQESYAEFKRVSSACAQLHNEGAIDLISIATIETLAAEETHRFFTLQGFYLEVIPGLQASLTEVLTLVEALVRRAGEDLASNQPYGALLLWLKKDQDRAERLVTSAQGGDKLALDHLTFALQALADVPRTQCLVREGTGTARLSALTALARIGHTHKEAESTGIIAGDLFTESSDDDIHAHALAALFGALSSASDTEINASNVLAALRTVGPQTQHQCAQILWLHARRLAPETRARLFQEVNTIRPEHKGILRTFDQALTATFEVAPDEAIAVCKRFLSNPDNDHELAELASFSSGLLDSPRFGATVLDWLLAGDYALCEGLHKLLQGRDRTSAPLQLPNDPPIDDQDAMFVAYKAVGYFFTQPVIAGSILVHLLRQAGKDAGDVLEGLLVDPLLSNYGGELRDYLLTIGVDDPAHGRVAASLSQTDAHLEQLVAIGRIPELRPSATERQIERVRHSDQMRASFKEARKGSLFLDLVSHSVVLHGRRTTSYRRLGDEPLQRFDMDLASHGVSFELPRVEAADPLGLDFLILTYRRLQRSDL